MVNFTIFYWVLGLICLGIIGLFIWIFYEKRRNLSEPQDRSQVLNYMPQYANGHNKGVLNRIIEQGEWIAVEFFPRDLNYVEMLKNKENLQLNPEVVFIPKFNLKITPRGTFSNHVNDIEIFPIKQEDIPSGMNREKREFLKNVIENNQQERHNLQVFESWKENSKLLQMKTSGLEIVQDYMGMSEEATKQVLKNMREDRSIIQPKKEEE